MSDIYDNHVLIYYHCLQPVSEKEKSGQQTSFGDKTDNTVSISVPIVVVLIFAVAVLLTLLIKRRHRTNTVSIFCL